MKNLMTAISILLLFGCTNTGKDPVNYERWSTEKANEWAEAIPWLVGTNFIPSTAINQLEMWQAESFDPETIDRELGWASYIGMNTMRVFLHNLLWEQDSEGLIERIDQYLEISTRHGIQTMLVLFDGVWDPDPALGTQRDPYPHRHNSGWVQSPGNAALLDTTTFPRLEKYVKGIMGHFKDDERIAIWDLFNEPENPSSQYEVLPNKAEVALRLLQKTEKWAREVGPSQPVTAGVWGSFLSDDPMTEISQFMLDHSDVISFHCYSDVNVLHEQIAYLETLGRPIFCTEYLARSRECTFENFLPVFKEHKIAAYNWGLVAGKTQTQYPWDSWDSVFTSEPELWHHEIFRPDGSPYRQAETELIRELTK